MLGSNKIDFNTKQIIQFINSKNINLVISSWGKGTSLSKEFKLELKQIKEKCPNVKFEYYELPAFGRPMISNKDLGEKIYNKLVALKM